MEFKIDFDFSKPKNFPVTDKLIKHSLYHIFLFTLFSIAIGIMLSQTRMDLLFWILYLLGITALILSWLDKINIIQLRKTPERLTKCSICGRTAVESKIKKLVDEEIIKKSGKDPEGEKYQEKTVTTSKGKEEISGSPFNAIIFHEKPICIQCINELSKMKEDLKGF